MTVVETPLPRLQPWEDPDHPAFYTRQPHPHAYERKIVTDPNDPAFYWVAPEDDLMQVMLHSHTMVYAWQAIRRVLTHRRSTRWAAHDLPAAWRRNDPKAVLAPDRLVGEPPSPGESESYRQWDHGHLRFVGEIASKSSVDEDAFPKTARYAESLQPDEYLFYNPANDDLVLYRWDGTRYVNLPSQQPAWAAGRVCYWSPVLELWFGTDATGGLRVYDRDGSPIAREEEQTVQLDEATARAEQEAEARRRETARADQEAEARRRETARADQEAARAAEAERLAADARREAAAQQARVEELTRRLAELERRTGSLDM